MTAPAENRYASSIHQSVRLLRLPDVCKTTGLSRSSIYKLESERKFPGRIKLTQHAVAWVEHEVHAWVAERILLSRL